MEEVEAVTKSKHDPGCGARESGRCDCEAGRLRRVRRRARAAIKRQRKRISERTGIPFEETLLERCAGADWYYLESDDCFVGRFHGILPKVWERRRSDDEGSGRVRSGSRPRWTS